MVGDSVTIEPTHLFGPDMVIVTVGRAVVKGKLSTCRIGVVMSATEARRFADEFQRGEAAKEKRCTTEN